ncbi:MAG: putative bifunctional diguanylate cyclase/phosphodiesterase [Burkholderiales bacterium]
MFACKLCWKIAAAVFVLILAIESAILVPSARRHEDGLIAQRVDAAIIALEPTLAVASYGRQPGLIQAGIENTIGKYGIEGVLVEGADGSRLAAAGESVGLEHAMARAAPMGAGAQYYVEGRRLDFAWPSETGVRIAARVDTAEVPGEVRAFMLRIAGLVVIIVLVVTVGTMLVLHGLLLRPVLRLRESSLRAAREPQEADRFAVLTRRRDEIGDLVAAHNDLLERVVASKRRDLAIAEERAHYATHHDPLTGLPNRTALLEHLERLRTERAGTVSLYLLNLEQFRVFNASFGTARGDELLVQLAARLREAARPGDFVAHFGADRFAIVRTNGEFEPGKAAEVAERLLEAVASGCALNEAARFSLAARIGIANAVVATLDAHSLVNEAELALARTRAEDAAQYEFYAPAFADEARSRQALRRDLERGIAAGEFFPVLQPKFALDADGGSHLAGAEVLVRWRHPERGLVSPTEFIPLAESSGFIVQIGERVLADACGLIRGWIDRYGWAPPLAVNLSARQFALSDLADRLERAMKTAAIDAALIEVEVTESAAMKDVARTAATLARLRALGVSVSIDDFGTGYSSLAYLKRFAVDAIKIDKSFVDDIGVDPTSGTLCDAILRLGQALGCKVVAEGVETELQLSFLRRRHCDEVQGYIFSKPLAAAEFESAWMADGRCGGESRVPELVRRSPVHA